MKHNYFGTIITIGIMIVCFILILCAIMGAAILFAHLLSCIKGVL